MDIKIAPPPPSSTKPEKRKKESIQLGKPASILIVEDRDSNALYADTILKKAGASTLVAENGRIALEHCKSQPFDLILMDLSMPELDGFETTRRIRKEEGPNQRTPILALTASCSKLTEDKCRQYGMQGFIAKPAQMNTLLNEVKKNIIPR